MREVLRNLIIIISIILGLYVGIWVMFVGGIMQIINGINPLNGLEIALGVCRVVFCELAVLIPVVGYILAEFLII